MMKYVTQMYCAFFLLTACTQQAQDADVPESIKKDLKAVGYEKAWPDADAKVQSGNAGPADYFKAAFLAGMLNKPEELSIIEKGLEKVDRSNPFYAALLLLRSDNYVGQSNFDAAINDLETVLTINADNYTALYNRGYIATMQGEHEYAIFLFQRILKTKPEDSATFNNLAYSCAEAGFHSNAIEYAEKGLKLVKGDQSKATLLNNMGLAMGLSGDIAGGLKNIAQSLQLYPDNSFAWRNKGILYLQENKVNLACESFAKSSALGGKNLVKPYIAEYCN